MVELLGFAYLVLGGVVTGQTLHAMWADDAFDKGPGEAFVGVMLLAMIFWLAWPVVWGVLRARKAYISGKEPQP